MAYHFHTPLRLQLAVAHRPQYRRLVQGILASNAGTTFGATLSVKPGQCFADSKTVQADVVGTNLTKMEYKEKVATICFESSRCSIEPRL